MALTDEAKNPILGLHKDHEEQFFPLLDKRNTVGTQDAKSEQYTMLANSSWLLP